MLITTIARVTTRMKLNKTDVRWRIRFIKKLKVRQLETISNQKRTFELRMRTDTLPGLEQGLSEGF